MTRSEIPQLEVITAIPDAESEDFLAQLLFSQGWNIIFRAFDFGALRAFLKARGAELRTVIVYQSRFPGFDPEIKEEFDSSTVTFICLDEIAFTSHEIMVAIRNELRAPMLQNAKSSGAASDEVADFEISSSQRSRATTPSPGFLTYPSAPKSSNPGSWVKPADTRVQSGGQMIQRANRPSKQLSRDRSVIAVTGSSGAPGRTRFSTALADQFALGGTTLLIDADIRSHGMGINAKKDRRGSVEVVPLDRESRPTRIPDGIESAVVDLGVLPGLSEAVNDRRWYGSLVNNVLDQASHLVYISKSTSASMTELSQFIREYPLLLKRLPVSYICILTGHSRELREWESKFLTLTTGENRYILREGELHNGQAGRFLPSFLSGKSKQGSIAKIATALR